MTDALFVTVKKLAKVDRFLKGVMRWGTCGLPSNKVPPESQNILSKTKYLIAGSTETISRKSLNG